MLRLKLIANTLMEKTQIQGNWSKMKLVAVKFFEIDKLQIVIAALDALCDQGKIPKSVLKSALLKYNINNNLEHPWNK